MKRGLKFCVVFLIFLALMLECGTTLAASSTRDALILTEVPAVQKALDTLSHFGLDLSKYNTTPKIYPNDLYRDTLPQEIIRCKLDSENSKVDALCTFINGSLHMIQILSSSEGSPHMTTATTDVAEKAKTFLNNYQTQTNNAFYGELQSMLYSIDANENSTTINENIKLAVTTTSTTGTTFRWTYITNGIEAPDKSVALSYQNSSLKYFMDNWGLYKVGNTQVNLSENEAIDIAIAHAKNYAPYADSDNATFRNLRYNVANAMMFETILSPSLYVDADKAHSLDVFELYPLRHVWVSLDKFYPGNVYGFNVYIWADTKQVCYLNERVSTMDPSEDMVADFDAWVAESQSVPDAPTKQAATLSNIWLVLTVFAVASLVMSSARLRRRRTPVRLLNFSKRWASRIGGGLFCFLLFSTLFLALLASPVNAAPCHGRATVWGSESEGSYNYSIGSSWRKDSAEVYWQQNTAGNISEWFANNGYSATNNQGTHNQTSNKADILEEISNNEATYSRIAVVDFDHGNGKNNTQSVISGAEVDEFHYLFEDNWGTREGGVWNTDDSNANYHAVFDAEIYDKTEGNTFFAFISTCNSAYVDNYWSGEVSTQGLVDGLRARGMPFAWSHGTEVFTDYPTSSPPAGTMSCNGYTDPDGGDFCFIGFNMGSAALNQTLNGTGYHLPLGLQIFLPFSDV